MQVTFRNTFRDMRLAERTFPWHCRWIWSRWASVVLAALFSLPATYSSASHGIAQPLVVYWIGFALAWAVQLRMRGEQNRQIDAQLHETTVTLRPEYLEARNDFGATRWAWSLVGGVVATPAAIVLRLFGATVMVVPRTALGDQRRAEQFFALAEQYWRDDLDRKAPLGDGPAAEAVAAAPPRQRVQFEVRAEEAMKIALRPATNSSGSASAGAPSPAPSPAPPPANSLRRVRRVCEWAAILTLLGIVLALFDEGQAAGDLLRWLFEFLLVTLVPLLAAFFVFRFLQQRATRALLRGAPAFPETCAVTPTGLAIASPWRQTFTRWNRVDDIQLDENYLCFWRRPWLVTFIPRRAFASPAALQEFVQSAHRCREADQSVPATNGVYSLADESPDNPYRSPREY